MDEKLDQLVHDLLFLLLLWTDIDDQTLIGP